MRGYLAALHQRRLTRRTVARRLAALRSLFRWLAREGRIAADPTAGPLATVALPEEDVYFFVVKDLTHGIQGTPAEGQPEGAYYEPGFEPGNKS